MVLQKHRFINSYGEQHEVPSFVLEAAWLSARQPFRSETPVPAAQHQHHSRTAGRCSVPLHYGLLLCRAAHFKHTRINDSILSPAGMRQHSCHHLGEAKTSGESVSRVAFACTITPMLVSLPSRQAAPTHQARVTQPSSEAC